MATRYWGINRGQEEKDVVEGSVTNSTDIEVTLDLSKSVTKSELLVKLDEIRNKIVADNWPPA